METVSIMFSCVPLALGVFFFPLLFIELVCLLSLGMEGLILKGIRALKASMSWAEEKEGLPLLWATKRE